MARVVELRSGELPPTGERHALVIASPVPPAECVPMVERGLGATFFAKDCERDILIMVGRARVWADERLIAHVYVRRETVADAAVSFPATLDAPAEEAYGPHGGEAPPRTPRGGFVAPAAADFGTEARVFTLP